MDDMKKYGIRIWCFGVALLGGFLAGCTQEDLGDITVPEEGVMTITLTPDIPLEVEVKSDLSNQDVDQYQINEVQIFQLADDAIVQNADGANSTYFNGTTDIKEVTGSDGKKYTVDVRIEDGVDELLIIANAGGRLTDTGLTNRASIETLSKVVSSEAALFTENQGIPMYGIWESGSGDISNIDMKRSVAKVTFKLSAAPADGGEFAINSIRVMNVPQVLYYLRDKSVNTAPHPTLTADDDLTQDYEKETYGNANQTIDKVKWADGSTALWMPSLSGEERYAELLTGEEELWWFMPENARGKGSATGEYEKNKENAPSGQGDYCTYVEIKGFYRLGELVNNNKVEAYNLPQGTLSQWFRDIAGRRPGTITKVGLRTFVDPRLEGGKINDVTKEDIVEVIELGGEEWLWYHPHKIDVAIIRGTTADEDGNVTMDGEIGTGEALAIAEAAKACGGIVIVQVKDVAAKNTLDPRDVKIPGVIVDYVVKADEADHMMTWDYAYNPAFNGDVKVPLDSVAPLKLNNRKIIARRCAMELIPDAVRRPELRRSHERLGYPRPAVPV